MAGKKGAVAQLQAEVNTEEDWEKMLEKEGLTVADIYSGWCGPCVGMVGNLKKIKLDIGGDTLHLAIVKSDEIEALCRFRNKCEPTWMFIAAGQLVNLMFGANAPRLARVITTELDRENKAIAGTGTRKTQPFDELTPEEEVRFAATEKIRLEELAKEEAERVAKQAEILRKKLEHLALCLVDFSVILLMPNVRDEDGSCEAWSEMLESIAECGLTVENEAQPEIDHTQFEEIVLGKETSEECNEVLESGPCIVKLLERKKEKPIIPLTEEEQAELDAMPVIDVLELLTEIIYGNLPTAAGKQKIDPESYVGRYGKSDDIPGLWTPSTPYAKAKAVLQYFPDLAERFAEPVVPPPAPRLAIMFDTSRVKEVTDVAAEYSEEVIGLGYFSEGDPEKAHLIARTYPDYLRIHKHITGLERIVVGVSRARSDPLLAFCTLTPLYISADDNDGFNDCQAFFPPGQEDEVVVSIAPSVVTITSAAEVEEEEEFEGYERVVKEVENYDDEENEDTLSSLFGPMDGAPAPEGADAPPPADAPPATAEAPPPPEEPPAA